MISILLATYNGEKYIRQSIDSVLSQTFKDFEILVGFNGTTDNTKEIVAEYTDTRIRVFDYGDDKGKAKTLNKLLKETKYEWIAIQDDDDIWLPKKLEMQSKFTERFDVIGTFIKYINEKNDVIGNPNLCTNDEEIKLRSLNGDNQIANTSTIIRKSALKKIIGWREGIESVEDYDLWLRLIRSGFRFYNVPEFLVKHRLHSESNFNANMAEIQNMLITEILNYK
jgi:glycosyltransferase involved in cell wall biosynthesis